MNRKLSWDRIEREEEGTLTMYHQSTAQQKALSGKNSANQRLTIRPMKSHYSFNSQFFQSTHCLLLPSQTAPCPSLKEVPPFVEGVLTLGCHHCTPWVVILCWSLINISCCCWRNNWQFICFRSILLYWMHATDFFKASSLRTCFYGMIMI